MNKYHIAIAAVFFAVFLAYVLILEQDEDTLELSLRPWAKRVLAWLRRL